MPSTSPFYREASTCFLNYFSCQSRASEPCRSLLQSTDCPGRTGFQKSLDLNPLQADKLRLRGRALLPLVNILES